MKSILRGRSSGSGGQCFALHRRTFILFVVVTSLMGFQLIAGPSAFAIGRTTTDFESFTIGSVNGQGGWSSGHGSSICPLYDEGVVSNTYGYSAFGAQSFRISNAITCGSYNDQTLSPSLVDEAGETSASTSTYSGGTRQPYFEAQWDFASTVPGSEQPGLSVVASADRGDPSRMSWLQMQDTPSGLQLNFEDYQHSIGNFVVTPIATGLDRTVPHTVKMTVKFVDGPENDVVNVYLDGTLIHTGTTWEDYYRDAGGIPAPVDSLMFRVAGTAAPATTGNGFLIDNFTSYSGPVPDADLTSLSLSSGTLSPAFDPAVLAYSASVGSDTNAVTVAAGTFPGATAVITGDSNLVVGSNVITITVTAGDGTTVKTYTVTVDRAAPPATVPTPPTPTAPAPTPPTPTPPAPAPPAAQQLGAPQSLSGSAQGGGGLLLSWDPPPGNPAVARYTVWKDGVAIGVTEASSRQLLVPGAVVGDAAIFEVSADDGNGNLSPRSAKLSGVPDLPGLTSAQAVALTISRGFTVGAVLTRPSSAASGITVGQDPSPLPAYRPLRTALGIVVSVHAASAPLIVKVATARRTPIGIRHFFTPLVLTTIAGKVAVSLTRYRQIDTTYAAWSRTLHAGANYLSLHVPSRLKLQLPGIYRLTFRVHAGGQSKLYSVRIVLSSGALDAPLPKREADVLLVATPSIPQAVVQRLSARYLVKRSDAVSVFTATRAPNERVGAVVLDTNDAGLATIRHLHVVFPDLRIVAIVSSPAASGRARARPAPGGRSPARRRRTGSPPGSSGLWARRALFAQTRDDGEAEVGGTLAVDDTVIERHRDVAHLAHDDLAVAHDCAIFDAVHAEDRNLGMVEQRRHEQAC